MAVNKQINFIMCLAVLHYVTVNAAELPNFPSTYMEIYRLITIHR